MEADPTAHISINSVEMTPLGLAGAYLTYVCEPGQIANLDLVADDLASGAEATSSRHHSLISCDGYPHQDSSLLFTDLDRPPSPRATRCGCRRR